MATAEFKFIDAYRRISPTTIREIVEARQKGHDKLYPLLVGTTERVYDACRLAFQLPNSSAVVEWFEKTVREFDPQFSVEHDKAEAGRIASLLLRDLMSRASSPQGAFAILVCSFCGQRTPVDGELLVAAREAVVHAARERRIVLAEKKIIVPPAKDLKAVLDAAQQSLSAETARAAFDGIIAELRNGITKTASAAADAHQSLRTDVVRLAEEVDMLWWHIGDWCEVLDRPRSDLPKEAVGVVSGVELGDFVRHVPGPYGAYGILRRTLGKTSDDKVKLKEAISSLAQDVKKLAHPLPQGAMTVFPVHAAIRLAADRGQDGWPAAFDHVASDIKDVDLSHFDLAVQAFRERVLIKHGGLGQ